MAQTASLGAGASAFTLPPGLEQGVSSVAAPAAPAGPPSSPPQGPGPSAAEDNEDASSPSKSVPTEGILEDVRKTVLADVDQKVADKMKDLWSRGKQLMSQIEVENQQKTSEFTAELARCREKQESLAAEHERLRSVLSGMVQQLARLGTLFGAVGQVASPSSASASAQAAALAAATCLAAASQRASGEDSTSDPAASPFGRFPGPPGPPLPPVPDFPFAVAPPIPSPGAPSAPGSTLTATPLSLAEALGPSDHGSAATQSVPVSLSNSLPSPSETAQTGRVFSFTLRKADGTDLGLNVSHLEDDHVLLVEGIRAEGAVEAWNRQCQGSAFAEKAVLPGDRIISVNDSMYDPPKMLEECRDKQLLKLTIVRGDMPLPPAPAKASATAKSTILRAEASEFVPTGGLSTEQTQKQAEAIAATDNSTA